MARASEAGFEDALCCGDIVGYGPEPNETIQKVQDLNAVTIRGNHDRVACGQDEPGGFNPHAKASAYWTREALSSKAKAYLESLPVGPLDVDETAQLVHGAVTGEDDYITSERDAAESFDLTDKHLTFFGHSHFPGVYSCDRNGNVATEFPTETRTPGKMNLRPGVQYLVNPGSVGQPRDGDTRSSFLIWDSDTRCLEFYRVEYPLEITQEKMKAARLPRYLIERLTHGR